MTMHAPGTSLGQMAALPMAQSEGVSTHPKKLDDIQRRLGEDGSAHNSNGARCQVDGELELKKLADVVVHTATPLDGLTEKSPSVDFVAHRRNANTSQILCCTNTGFGRMQK